jgi:DNA replication protein DnaC
MSETSGNTQLPFPGIVPAENLNSSFENFRPQTEFAEYAVALAREFVATQDTPAGLLMVGEAGTGKTHLAVAIARAHAENGGQSAFMTFSESHPDTAPIPDPPVLGWWGQMSKMARTFDLVVVDDLPGDMVPGVSSQLQRLVLASFNEGTKLVFTSNQPVETIVRQLARRSSDGDKTVAVIDRLKQAWQTVEFEGASYRSTLPKWWRNVPRPEGMPNTLAEVAADIQRGGEYALLLGDAVREFLELAGSHGPALDGLAAFIERERNRQSPS